MKGGFFEEMDVGLYAVKSKAEKKSERERGIVSPKTNNHRASGQRAETCEDCGLYKTCKSPKMEPSGKGRLQILAVAEAPGADEDRLGTQLVGKAGQYLRDILSELDLDLDLDFWKTNAVACRPPENRTPTLKELRICRSVKLLNAIEMYRPRAILLMGEPAFESYMGPRLVGRIKKISYSNWIGEVIPDQELGMWICPIYHPSYLMRLGGDKVLERMYREQLRAIVKAAQNPVPKFIPNKVQTTTDPDQAIAWIEELKRTAPPLVAFDYETTGRKPHRPGHRIVCMSFCYDGAPARAFLFDQNVGEKWAEVLQDEEIGKVCQNISFEDMWSDEILGTQIRGPRVDTLLASHSLNNKKNVGLKFQVYTKFGVLGYDSELDPYIEGVKPGEDPDSANAFNRVDEAPKDKLLTYNGDDSAFTLRLHKLQQEMLEKEPKLRPGMQFFFDSTRWLVRAQQRGVRIDKDRMEEQKKKMDRRLVSITERIMDSPEVKRWDGKEAFKFTSPDQLSHLLFDILELDPVAKTGTGKNSVDDDVLEELDLPLAKDIREYRRWNKARTTYLGQYERELVGEFIHPFFGLGLVSTYRSSSSDPNFQNAPVREERIMHAIRSMIVPRRGNRLINYDFKGMEVSTSACYNKDPALIHYIEDPKSDMHRDQAAEIFKRPIEDVVKLERYLAKNGYVFPAFYGSYFVETAPDLWKRMPDESRAHLAKHGIRELGEVVRDNKGNIIRATGFYKHIQEIDRVFWEEKFPVYAQWKKDTVKEFERRGFVDLYTGFRCLGPMRRNEVVNYPIQGSAFHILLWTFNRVSEATQDLEPRSGIIGQIHDSIVADVHPDDEPVFDNLVLDYGTRKVREAWPWIVVPLTIEKDRSAIDGNWAEMEGCGMLGSLVDETRR